MRLPRGSRSSLDAHPDDLLRVSERDLLELRIDGRAGPGKDRHLEAELTRVDSALDDARLGRAAGEDEALDLELAQEQLERCVVERGVPRLEQERLARARGKVRDDIRAVAAERFL